MGYDDGFRIICVVLCVTPVSPEFRDAAAAVAKRKSRAVRESGGKRIVDRVFAAFRGFVSQQTRSKIGGRSASSVEAASPSQPLQLAVGFVSRAA